VQNTYDEQVYDKQPTEELRYIFKALKEDVFIDDLEVEWNNLFFTSIRYIFSEQLYVDWAFKTSFLSAIHNVGSLIKKTNYKNDNLESFQQYLEEVKPFRTTIREYTSRYTGNEVLNGAVTDFDNPPVYDEREGKIVSVTANSEVSTLYPWKYWLDNSNFIITEIRVTEFGTGYLTPPQVVINGTGTGATAQAYISNGSVSGIKILTAGTGFVEAPEILLVGGNGTSQNTAKAIAVIGDSKVRSFDLTVKFDRITKTGIYSSLTSSDRFVSDGNSAIFNLRYPPTRDKSKIKVYKNDVQLLTSDYNISFYKSNTDMYELTRGRLQLTVLPLVGDIIDVDYEKSVDILDSVDRINRLYRPAAGMLGTDLNQLMTGIDFGGVQIQGTTFDVSGGWDALPWFTDNWDSVEPNSDYYYAIDSEEYMLTDDQSIPKNYRKGAVVKFEGKQYRALRDNVDKPPIEFPLDWAILSIELPYTPAQGQLISIYYKPAGNEFPRSYDTLGEATNPTVVMANTVYEPRTIRIDDPNFNTPQQTNPDAVMPSFIGNGVLKLVNIQTYLSINDGDTLIFRLIDSDGTVNITDTNIIDTKLSGGSFSNIYETASGMLAEDIIVEGGKLTTPDHVPAPEEQVPGQVLESLSIQVYHTTNDGAAPLQTTVYIADGTTRRYKIGLSVVESQSLMVYVDKIKYDIIQTDSSTEYNIDYVENEIEFTNAPAANSIIEVIAIGVGGVALLDYQEFEADGDTNLFLTKADYDLTQSVVVTVDGVEVDVGYANSGDILEVTNKTLIQFSQRPNRRQIVKIVCLGSALDTDSGGQSVIRVNQEQLIFDGSTRRFSLDRFVNLSRGSSTPSALVELNGNQLKGVDTIIQTYTGTNNVIIIGIDPVQPFGAAINNNIKVFVNKEIKTFIIDYIYEGQSNKITIASRVLNVGDEIRIEVDSTSDYYFEDNDIIIRDSVTMVENDILQVTWFSEYPSFDIVSDEYTGGKVRYKLSRVPLTGSYVWIYKNGIKLTKDQDYEISVTKRTVYLKDVGTTSDEIKIVQFGAEIRREPSAYEIYKDMLNIYTYKRFSRSKQVVLSKALTYYDQTIELTDAANLFEPIPERNIPGTVSINSERIEYFAKDGNILSRLRRGSHGTSIAEFHDIGSEVVDISPNENLPYNETQDRQDFVSDGSTLLVGPLNFVPSKGTRLSWFTETIPEENGPCDQVEVFVGGRRLRKDPVTQYVELNGVTSPDADEQVEAEFSVDGANPYIQLTEKVPAGTRITVIRRTGKTWYDRGESTATSGKTLIDNNSPILQFVTLRSTELPE
jgi:hypothetical protein